MQAGGNFRGQFKVYLILGGRRPPGPNNRASRRGMEDDTWRGQRDKGKDWLIWIRIYLFGLSRSSNACKMWKHIRTGQTDGGHPNQRQAVGAEATQTVLSHTGWLKSLALSPLSRMNGNIMRRQPETLKGKPRALTRHWLGGGAYNAPP